MASTTPVFVLLDLVAAPLVIAGLIDQLADRIRHWRAGRDRAPSVEPEERYQQAHIAERAGRIEAARDAFEEVVRRVPEHAGAHARLAALAAARGDHQTALA